MVGLDANDAEESAEQNSSKITKKKAKQKEKEAVFGVTRISKFAKIGKPKTDAK
uniref:Nucleolar protein 56 n=1 Tax=Steinernema glaseri TaxID=37863 RepID=A0A1I8AD44_9BILA